MIGKLCCRTHGRRLTLIAILAVMVAAPVSATQLPAPAGEQSPGTTEDRMPPAEVDVRRTGAKCDGASDDTRAIQSALDLAVARQSKGANGGGGGMNVVFPPGICQHGPLTLAPAAGNISVNLIGTSGAAGTVLRYVGTAADGVAITISDNVSYTVRDITLLNGSRNAAAGFLFTSRGPGSGSGPELIQNVHVSGFPVCYQIGDAGHSASEFTFLQAGASQCSTAGWRMQGRNITNLWFNSVTASNNRTTFQLIGPPEQVNVQVHGCSVSLDDLVFDMQTPVSLTVSGCTVEGKAQLARIGPAGPAAGGAVPSYVILENDVLDVGQTQSGYDLQFYSLGRYYLNNVQGNLGIQVAGPAGGRAYLTVYGGAIGAGIRKLPGNSSVWYVRTAGVGGDPTNSNTFIADEFYILQADGSKRSLLRADTAADPTSLAVDFSSGANLRTLTVGVDTVPFSPTPTFDCSRATLHAITLAGDVTSSALVHCGGGQAQWIVMKVCQDAVGGHAFVPPANMRGFTRIGSAANKCTVQPFLFTGTAAYAVAVGAVDQ